MLSSHTTLLPITSPPTKGKGMGNIKDVLPQSMVFFGGQVLLLGNPEKNSSQTHIKEFL